ncbi:hypothetical protein [Streptomyces sp. NPDC005408]|uniref:hypothetical protein n=1 Tax=Streptomyces sp. NPDC005408 TaxID=3155341 RepID=UPI0033BA6B08
MTTGRGVRRAGAVTAVVLLSCGLLVSCGQEKQEPSTVVADGSVQGQSGPAEGNTDETTDESGTAQPDLTTEGDGEPVLTSEEQMAGWYDAKADFRGHLSSNKDRTDDALGPMAGKVIIRKVGDTNEAQIWIQGGYKAGPVMELMADAFAKWRQDVYDDKGHMSVLRGPKEDRVDRDW